VNKAIARLMTNLEGSTIRSGFKYAWGAGGVAVDGNNNQISGRVGSGSGHRQWITDIHSVKTIPPVRHNELFYMQVDDTNNNFILKPTFPIGSASHASRLNSPHVTNEHLQVWPIFQDPNHCVAYKQFPLLPPIYGDYDSLMMKIANGDVVMPDNVKVMEHETRQGDKIKIKNNYIKLAFNVQPDLDRHLPMTDASLEMQTKHRFGDVSNNPVTGIISTSSSGLTDGRQTFPSYSIDKKEWYVDVRIVMAERPICDNSEFNFNDIIDSEKTKIKYQTTNATTYTTDTDPEKIAKSIFNAKYTDKEINPPGSELNRERKIFKDETFRIDWKGRHKTTSKIYNLMKGKVLEFSKDPTVELTGNSKLYNIKKQYAFIVMVHTHNCRCYVEMNQVLTFDK